jgi:hypothetical protein
MSAPQPRHLCSTHIYHSNHIVYINVAVYEYGWTDVQMIPPPQRTVDAPISYGSIGYFLLFAVNPPSHEVSLSIYRHSVIVLFDPLLVQIAESFFMRAVFTRQTHPLHRINVRLTTHTRTSTPIDRCCDVLFVTAPYRDRINVRLTTHTRTSTPIDRRCDVLFVTAHTVTCYSSSTGAETILHTGLLLILWYSQIVRSRHLTGWRGAGLPTCFD